MMLAVGVSVAQDSGQADAQASQSRAPTAEAGATMSSPQNPPISSLDAPKLEPPMTARSFLQPGAHISQSVDSNVTGSNGDATWTGVTRVLGSLELQRLWSRYQTSIGYIGGAAFYSYSGSSASQIHQVDADQRVSWQKGQLALQDAFTYFPEGAFGYGSYGGAGIVGSLPIGGLVGGYVGGSTFFGPGQLASIGQQPRISNTALAQLSQSLTARSAITLTGSYGLVDFLDNPQGYINSRQVTAQAGYNYQLNRKDQVALVYGFQSFSYPSSVGGDFTTHLFNVLYGHRISGRMDMVIGGGPQVTILDDPFTGSDTKWSFSGRAGVRYRFPTTGLALNYEHYNTSGSGFFAGAQSDVVRFSVGHALNRNWDMNADVGYTHNTRIQPIGVVTANSFDYLFAGAGLRRQLGRSFSAFVSYQFNYLTFDDSLCTTGPCNTNSQRHVVLVGLDWHPHPIRLD